MASWFSVPGCLVGESEKKLSELLWKAGDGMNSNIVFFPEVVSRRQGVHEHNRGIFEAPLSLSASN